MEKRQIIVYLETEYGLGMGQAEPSTEIKLLSSLNNLLQQRYPYLERIQQRPGRFLSNGGLVVMPTVGYTAHKASLRWTTPECLDACSLALYEQAGEHLLMELLGAVRTQLSDPRIVAWKNNHDVAQQVVPCYEHYLHRPNIPEERIARYLIPFLISRPILCGSGAVAENSTSSATAGDVSFELSQRRRDIRILVQRDAITTDCLLSLSQGYIGVFGGDSNMSASASLLKVGSTLMVIELMLADRLPFVVSLENPLLALRTVSQDLTFQTRIAQSEGQRISAIEIQDYFLNAAQSYYSSSQDPVIRSILTLWEEVLVALKNDPSDLTIPDWSLKKKLLDQLLQKDGGWERLSLWMPLIRRLDQAKISISKLNPSKVEASLRIKLSLSEFNDFERYMIHHQLLWNELQHYYSLYYRVKMIDLQYHELDREQGLFYRLLHSGRITSPLVEEDVVEALSKPPSTRAALRGEFVRIATAQTWPARADWGQLQLGQRVLTLSDPWSDKHSEWNTLLAGEQV
jgi:hypothetical protein